MQLLDVNPAPIPISWTERVNIAEQQFRRRFALQPLVSGEC